MTSFALATAFGGTAMGVLSHGWWSFWGRLRSPADLGPHTQARAIGTALLPISVFGMLYGLEDLLQVFGWASCALIVGVPGAFALAGSMLVLGRAQSRLGREAWLALREPQQRALGAAVGLLGGVLLSGVGIVLVASAAKATGLGLFLVPLGLLMPLWLPALWIASTYFGLRRAVTPAPVSTPAIGDGDPPARGRGEVSSSDAGG
jgi:hypothetical protein